MDVLCPGCQWRRELPHGPHGYMPKVLEQMEFRTKVYELLHVPHNTHREVPDQCGRRVTYPVAQRVRIMEGDSFAVPKGTAM